MTSRIRLTSLLLVACTALAAHAQATIPASDPFYEDFEVGLGGFTQNSWFIDNSGRGFSGNTKCTAFGFDGTLTSPVYDFSNTTTPRIVVAASGDAVTTGYMGVEVDVGDGLGWQEVAQWTSFVIDWRFQFADIPQAAGRPAVQIRFVARWTPDPRGTDVSLDDLYILPDGIRPEGSVIDFNNLGRGPWGFPLPAAGSGEFLAQVFTIDQTGWFAGFDFRPFGASIGGRVVGSIYALDANGNPDLQAGPLFTQDRPVSVNTEFQVPDQTLLVREGERYAIVLQTSALSTVVSRVSWTQTGITAVNGLRFDATGNWVSAGRTFSFRTWNHVPGIGTNEDFRLSTAVNGRDGDIFDKVVSAGDVITLRIFSRNQTFAGSPFIIGASTRNNGTLAPAGALPGISLPAIGTTIIMDSTMLGGPFGPILLPASGLEFRLDAPAFLSGQTVRVQAIAVSPNANALGFASTAAQDLIFR